MSTEDHTALIAELEAGDGNGCRIPNDVMRRAASALSSVQEERDALVESCSEAYRVGAEGWRKATEQVELRKAAEADLAALRAELGDYESRLRASNADYIALQRKLTNAEATPFDEIPWTPGDGKTRTP